MNQIQIRQVKKELLFLKQYAANLRMHSALYGGKEEMLYVEDELVDYLHYTRSIIDCSHHPHHYENPLLKAMIKKEQAQQLKKEQDYRAYMIMQALEQLEPLEKRLLMDVYIKSLPKSLILRHQGEVVESTYYRRLNKACIHLYELLEGFQYPFS